MNGDRSTWLVVFSEVDGLRWVVEHSRMAFSERQCPRARGIIAGDELVLYMARGAYHNPTRDRSQIIGWARAISDVGPLRSGVMIRDRQFVCGCELDIERVLPERGGMPFEPLIEKLGFIRRKEVWGQYLRSSLIALPPADAMILRHAFERFI